MKPFVATGERRERSVIFDGPMIRAALANRKTTMRLPVKWPDWANPELNGPFLRLQKPAIGIARYKDGRPTKRMTSPFGLPGDHLRVLEKWCFQYDDDGPIRNEKEGRAQVHYAADGVEVRAVDGDGFGRYRKDGTEASPWQSPTHMPRKASRLTLEVVDVRVEQLWQVDEAGAAAEGYEPAQLDGIAPEQTFCGEGFAGPRLHDSPRRFAMAIAWDEKHDGLYPWSRNPWVWVCTFRRVS